MANSAPALIAGSQSKTVTLDTTTTDLVLGEAPASSIGSCIIQVVDLGSWSGAIIPQARLIGGASTSAPFVSVAYENLASGAEVAAGSSITAAGLYAIRLDHGMELAIDYTHTSGTGVRINFKFGVG